MKKFLNIIVVLFLLGDICQVNAMPLPDPPPGKTSKTPIDMGVALLLVAGVGLGIKKFKK